MIPASRFCSIFTPLPQVEGNSQISAFLTLGRTFKLLTHSWSRGQRCVLSIWMQVDDWQYLSKLANCWRIYFVWINKLAISFLKLVTNWSIIFHFLAKWSRDISREILTQYLYFKMLRTMSFKFWFSAIIYAKVIANNSFSTGKPLSPRP